MASPIESPREPAKFEAAERARLDSASDAGSDASAVAPPAATTEVQTGLDSATRDSLSRLAALIRKTADLTSPTDVKAEPNEESGAESDRSFDDESRRKREAAMKAMLETGTNELAPPQAAANDTFPAIVRLERCFERALRERGSQIYQRQKSKDAVQLILKELEKRQENNDSEIVDELLAVHDVPTRRAAA